MRFIAEIGSSWRGQLDILDRMVDSFSSIGFELFKLQAYNFRFWNRHPEYKYLKNACVTSDNIRDIDKIFKKYGVEWFCTPTYITAIDFINPYVKRWKIRYKDKNDLPLINKCLQTGKEVILSTKYPLIEHTKMIKNMYVIPTYPATMEQFDTQKADLFDGYSNHIPDKEILMLLVLNYPCWEYVEIYVTPNKIIPHIDNNISFDLFECKEILEHTMKCLA